MASIQIVFSPVGGGSNTSPGLGVIPAYHETLIYTNDAGEVYYARGGPQVQDDGSKVLVTEHDEYKPFTPDYPVLEDKDGNVVFDSNGRAQIDSAVYNSWPKYQVASGVDAALDVKWNAINASMDRVNDLHLQYIAISQNSNSAASQALRDAGYAPPDASILHGVPWGGVISNSSFPWAPGTENHLDGSDVSTKSFDHDVFQFGYYENSTSQTVKVIANNGELISADVSDSSGQQTYLFDDSNDSWSGYSSGSGHIISGTHSTVAQIDGTYAMNHDLVIGHIDLATYGSLSHEIITSDTGLKISYAKTAFSGYDIILAKGQYLPGDISGNISIQNLDGSAYNTLIDPIHVDNNSNITFSGNGASTSFASISTTNLTFTFSKSEIQGKDQHIPIHLNAQFTSELHSSFNATDTRFFATTDAYFYNNGGTGELSISRNFVSDNPGNHHDVATIAVYDNHSQSHMFHLFVDLVA